MTTAALATEREETFEELAVAQILLRRRVLEWRDHWIIEAEVRLRARGLAVTADLAKIIAGLRTHELMAARAGITHPPALPAIVEEVSLEAARLTIAAHDALKGIVAHHLAIEAEAGKAGRSGAWADQVLAVGQGIIPLAAAAGLLAALPSLATTTTAVMLGFAAVTTVSAPILLAGTGGAAVLGALGVVNLKGLRGAEERKLRAAIEAEMERRLFAPAGGDGDPSLLAQLQRGLADAALQMTRES